MKFAEIKSKRRCSQLYSAGMLGNSLKTWSTPEEYHADPDKYHKVVIRQKTSAGGGICIYGVPEAEATERFRELQAAGHKCLYLSEQLPGQPECMTFQGEYILGGDVPSAEYLRYSLAKAFHREAMGFGDPELLKTLPDPKEYSGPGCRLIMRQAMRNEDYERLMEFAETYPGHIIEFSCSDSPFGSLGQYMIIWEIRKF